MTWYSKSSQFCVEEHYSEIICLYLNIFIQTGEPLPVVTSNKFTLKCDFYAQCQLVQFDIKCSSSCLLFVPLTHFCRRLLPLPWPFLNISLPSNSKLLYSEIQYFGLNCWYNYYFSLWIKYRFIKFANHCFFVIVYQYTENISYTI